MSNATPECTPDDHSREKAKPQADGRALEKAAQLLRALGDASRLHLIQLLAEREWCVTEIVETLQENFSTVSQRLRILRNEGLVKRRREGTHVYYSLADQHVLELMQNALAHAKEL